MNATKTVMLCGREYVLIPKTAGPGFAAVATGEAGRTGTLAELMDEAYRLSLIGRENARHAV